MGNLLDDPGGICLWTLMDHFYLTWEDVPSYSELERTRGFTRPRFWEWGLRQRRERLRERMHWEMMTMLLKMFERELAASSEGRSDG